MKSPSLPLRNGIQVQTALFEADLGYRNRVPSTDGRFSGGESTSQLGFSNTSRESTKHFSGGVLANQLDGLQSHASRIDRVQSRGQHPSRKCRGTQSGFCSEKGWLSNYGAIRSSIGTSTLPTGNQRGCSVVSSRGKRPRLANCQRWLSRVQGTHDQGKPTPCHRHWKELRQPRPAACRPHRGRQHRADSCSGGI